MIGEQIISVWCFLEKSPECDIRHRERWVRVRVRLKTVKRSANNSGRAADFAECTMQGMINYYFLSFAVQIYPCESNPCQNGATCNNDVNDISKYKCQCRDWFTGVNCEGN